MDINNRIRYVPTKEKNFLNTVALVGRIVTLPAVLAAAVLCTVLLVRPTAFVHGADFFVALFTLGVCPVLAYPLAKAIPSLRKRGREGMRDTAFFASLIGYLFGAVYVYAVGASAELCFVQVTYFFSAVFLFFCNKVVGIRASAHSCGSCGAALLFAFVIGRPIAWLLSLAIVFYSCWSSLYRKSHTGKEFFFGGLCVLGGFTLSLICALFPAAFV